MLEERIGDAKQRKNVYLNSKNRNNESKDIIE
jgi:hypothetical protein